MKGWNNLNTVRVGQFEHGERVGQAEHGEGWDNFNTAKDETL